LESGIVFDIKKFSIHDGPGIRTTIFLKGCPLHCVWCHNPEGISPGSEIFFWEGRCIACQECVNHCSLQALSFDNGVRVLDKALCDRCGLCAEACPTGATEHIGKTMTVSEVLAEIEKDVAFYDQSGGGVTFSGGEPLFQPDFLEALLVASKEHDIHTTVDTSGCVSPDRFYKILGNVDLFLYDLKLMDEDRHIRSTGVSNQLILNNLKELVLAGKPVIVRIPVIPGINDDDENLAQTGAFLASLEQVRQVDILPYHRTATDKYRRLDSDYALQGIEPPSGAAMSDVARKLESFGLTVKIGG
jgi:pyruvate formate lyase activating enzyme